MNKSFTLAGLYLGAALMIIGIIFSLIITNTSIRNVESKDLTQSSKTESIITRSAPQIIGSILSAIVAIGIFYLGQKISNRKESDKEEKRLANIKLLFYIALLRWNKGIRVQIKEFKDRETDIKENKKNNVALLSHPNYSIISSPQSLLQIDKNDVFKFFVQQHSDNDRPLRIRLYSDLYNALEVVSTIISQMKEAESTKTERYAYRKNEIVAKSAELTQKLMSASQLAKQNKGSVAIDDPFYVQIAKIYGKFKEGKEDFTIDHKVREFIHPSLILALKEEFIGHSDSISVVSICEEAQVLYNLILEDIDEQLNQITHWGEHYSAVATIVSSIIILERQNFSFGEEIFDTQPNI